MHVPIRIDTGQPQLVRARSEVRRIISPSVLRTQARELDGERVNGCEKVARDGQEQKDEEHHDETTEIHDYASSRHHVAPRSKSSIAAFLASMSYFTLKSTRIKSLPFLMSKKWEAVHFAEALLYRMLY